MRPVVWSDSARKDFASIIRYIAEANAAAAERVAHAIEKAGNDLSALATGRPGRVTGTYEKLIGRLPYVIAYTLTGQGGHETIAILRVVRTARDWPPEDWPR